MKETYHIKKTADYRIGSALVCVLFLFSSFAAAQKLPDTIRGYKVYQTKISVKNQSEENSQSDEKNAEANSETLVKIGAPELVDVSLTGITLELPIEINSLDQNGTVDFLTFKDFRVNGLAVEVAEYKESFTVKKNRTTVLPEPVKIFIGTGQTLRGALKEFKNSKDEWTVTGTVFIFGRFKKAFLSFKRVVPVEINLTIKNPLDSTVARPAEQ